ncbi:hypothetical protein niasHT_040106 [Heterodera trifolii]|uniref:Uncharacterized protein n=1 Tax=Heterodera trifolii TaxID=157864 RepID=A0ABD2I1C7_9BILA
MALLERFYLPTRGSIVRRKDGREIKDSANFRADAVRLHNSREYHLRNGGQRTHNARAIVRAAEQANVHNFVLGLPEGRQKGIGKCPQGADLSCDCAPIVDHPKFGHNFLVIKDGRVVEQSVHDELMNRGGIYTTLCETQILKEDATE